MVNSCNRYSVCSNKLPCGCVYNGVWVYCEQCLAEEQYPTEGLDDE